MWVGLLCFVMGCLYLILFKVSLAGLYCLDYLLRCCFDILVVDCLCLF